LTAELRRAASTDARIVLLEGGDGVFCRGLDLDPRGASTARAGVEALAECLHTLRGLDKITVAAVDGAAIGGGVGIAAPCDLVIATERATFGLPELLYGVVPAVMIPYLQERWSPQKLRLAGLSAQTFSAAEAVQNGLADVLTADLGAAMRFWGQRLARVQPAAVRLWKEMTAPACAAAAVEVMAGSLEDPAVAQRIHHFVAHGIAPWHDAGPAEG
jgi:enoyl-CoA hydratase/carnithine racemase